MQNSTETAENNILKWKKLRLSSKWEITSKKVVKKKNNNDSYSDGRGKRREDKNPPTTDNQTFKQTKIKSNQNGLISMLRETKHKRTWLYQWIAFSDEFSPRITERKKMIALILSYAVFGFLDKPKSRENEKIWSNWLHRQYSPIFALSF